MCGVSTIITDNKKMVKFKTIVFAVLFFAAIIFVSSCSTDSETVIQIDETEQSLAKTSNPSANGQGAIFLNYDGFVPGVQHFSFHANTDNNGIVTGSFETKWGVNGRVHGTIDCLTILPDGKTAIMTGTVTHVQGDAYLYYGFEVGMNGWFKVQDNGEGANATEDNITDFYVDFNGPPCTYDLGFDLLSIQYGNIQVNP